MSYFVHFEGNKQYYSIITLYYLFISNLLSMLFSFYLNFCQDHHSLDIFSDLDNKFLNMYIKINL